MSFTESEFNPSNYKDVLKIYNSNKDFLLHHLGQSQVDEAFIIKETLEMKEHGFCSQLVLQNGMPIAILEYMLQSSGSVYLSLLMLLKDSQNKGLGTDIYRFFEQNMINIRASEIRIDVVNDYHPNVVPFWERMGFVGQNEDTLTWGQKTSIVLVMKKFL